MKKIFFFAATCLAFAACSNESLVDEFPSGPGKDGAIKFVMNQKNMTRAYKNLQDADHYNFGVFAYKNTDMDNAVMPNYLVGYYDEAKAYQAAGTTVGDQAGQVDGQSYWMYEGMGKAEYAGTYAGGELTDEFKSNNANQYLKFWDNAASQYCFYAYAPYLNKDAVGATAHYVDGVAKDPSTDKYVLTIPNGLLKAGNDNPALSEYMYASQKVTRGSYGLDVPLQFHRLNAKVNIKFWEDINGYKVRILDLQEGATGLEGVQAAASIKKTSDDPEAGPYTPYGYRAGKYYLENGVKIQFDKDAKELAKHQFQGKLAEPAAAGEYTKEVLKFQSPVEPEIGETRFTAAASPTTYYALPKADAQVIDNTSNDQDLVAADADLKKTGFTFHVSYELTAEDTGERIRVNNATVHVPANYCEWTNNTHYTYIFKITKNSNGTTVDPTDPTDPTNPTIDPTNPDVPEVQALYPIVFDNCTIEDWVENESEWVISEGDNIAYHDVQLTDPTTGDGKYSLAFGEIKVTVTDNDKWTGAHIDYNNITVTGPADANVTSWYDAGTQVITVPASAALGVYTVTYECKDVPASTTHPAKWSETFYVGDTYTVETHVTEIGTGAADAAKLNITSKKGNDVNTPAAAAASQLKIEYPDNFTDAQMAEVKVVGTDVVVTKNATPGAYKLIYTVDQGKEVKVAQQIFNVVDYNFALSAKKVFNKVGGNTIKATVKDLKATTTGIYTVSSTELSVDNTNNEITIPNNTAEGEYTVTYTVNGDNAAKTVYTNTFNVANTHAVSVSKKVLQSQLNWDNASEFAKDFLYITTTFNGVDATAEETGVLTIENAAGADKTADFSIVWDADKKLYKLQAKTSVAPVSSDIYYVVYTKPIEGVDTKTKAEFIVTK